MVSFTVGSANLYFGVVIMTTEYLEEMKRQVERSAIDQCQPLPDGFSITYNETTEEVKLFLNNEAYANLSNPGDMIISQWDSGKWTN
jgi:hypothetical protein